MIPADVYKRIEAEKQMIEMDKLVIDLMLKNKRNKNGYNNSLISSHPDKYDSEDESDYAEQEEEKFAKILKEYKLSRCKDEFAKNGIISIDSLKCLNYQELNQIELKLPKLKRKQFIKLVQSVSDVCKDYKTDKDGKNTRNNAIPNANNRYTFYNNSINNYSVNNGFDGSRNDSFIFNAANMTGYRNNFDDNMNISPQCSPSINTSPLHRDATFLIM